MNILLAASSIRCPTCAMHPKRKYQQDALGMDAAIWIYKHLHRSPNCSIDGTWAASLIQSSLSYLNVYAATDAANTSRL